jgi:hypothetical protein
MTVENRVKREQAIRNPLTTNEPEEPQMVGEATNGASLAKKVRVSGRR